MDPGLENRGAVAPCLYAGWLGVQGETWGCSAVGAMAWGSMGWGCRGPRRGGVGVEGVQGGVVVPVGDGSVEPGRWGQGSSSIGCPVYIRDPVAQPRFVGLVCNRPRCG